MASNSSNKRRIQNVELQGTGNCPVKTDSTVLLNHFPEELWLIILSHVNDYQSYQKICDASSCLADLLKEQRTFALLEPVLEVMIKHNVVKGQNRSLAKNDALPVNFLSLREVCRSWKFAVDKTLQNPVYHQSLYLEQQQTIISSPMEKLLANYTTRLYKVADMTKFQQQFDDTHDNGKVNPFPSRNLLVSPEHVCDADLPQFSLECTRLIRKYGENVWYLHFVDNFDNYPSRVPIVWNILQKSLPSMPKLKMLVWDDPVKRHRSPLSFSPAIIMAHLASIRMAMMNRSTPGDPLPATMLRARPMPNLATLDQGNMTFEMLMRILNTLLPKLENLSVKLCSKPQLLFILRKPELKQLKTLKLDLSGLKLSWQEIFAELEQSSFGATLQHLYIWLPKQEGLIPKDKLKLPGLQEIFLKVESQAKLNVLLSPMKEHLEQISVKVAWSMTSAGQSNFYEHLIAVKNPLAWTGYSKLKQISVYGLNQEKPFWQSGKPNRNYGWLI